MRLSFVPFLMGSLLLVACPGPPPSTDAGQPETDAGQPETDAGQPETDAGQPETDAGQPETDAGQPETDAGQPETDAGQPETDAGQPETDAGQPETDAGQWAIPSIDPEKLANYRKELGGRSFQDILAALRALPSDRSERWNGRLSAMRQLTSLFVLQPSEASKVHEVLQSDLPHDAMSAFIGALSSASMPECVHALSDASLDPKLPPDVRVDAVSALGTAQWPTAEGFGALWSLWREAGSPAREVRDTAMLAIGNATQRLAPLSARAADRVVGELSLAYHSAPTDEDRALVLRSLGNTGLESALPLLREALEAENHELRANAVMGLRKIPGAGVDEVLINALLHDTQWEVRREAVDAISYRPIGAFLDGLRQAMSLEPVVLVRLDIVWLLAKNRTDGPAVDAMLDQVARTDRSLEVRRAAAQVIGLSPVPTDGLP